MFDGFVLDDLEVEPGVTIRYRHGGEGPPLLLLHGNPMSHVSWHRVAGPLAERFHVVAPDLRGYGDSSLPPEPGPDNLNYSFRAMARDQVALMRHLGHERFAVAGHDRGGRVVHRLCLDHPELVERAAVLDIGPSQRTLTTTSVEGLMSLWHWAFMAQPSPLPERMMASVPAEWFLRRKIGLGDEGYGLFGEEAFAEYLRCFTPKTIEGSCGDYRATVTCDLAMDTADLDRRIEMPLLVLWGARSHSQRVLVDMLAVWRERATDVTGGPIDCGHYVNEEAPDAVLAAFHDFFG